MGVRRHDAVGLEDLVKVPPYQRRLGQDPSQLSKVGNGADPPVGPGVAGTHQHGKIELHQRPGIKRFGIDLRQRCRPQHHVQITARELGMQAVGHTGHHADPCVRKARLQADKRPRKRPVQPDISGTDQHFILPGALNMPTCAAQLGLDRLRVMQQDAAEGVGRHPARVPVEQGRIEFLLQPADKPRERGLVHAEFVGGRGYVAALGDLQEKAEVVEVHGISRRARASAGPHRPWAWRRRRAALAGMPCTAGRAWPCGP